MTLTDDALGLTDYRTRIAQVLQNGLPDEISVWDCIPDSITPPAVYVAWSNPWMVNTTWCQFTTGLQLIVVAQRIEPGGQYGIIESMVGSIIQLLQQNRIAIRDVNSPFPINLGGVDYLAAAINLITEMS